MFFSVVTKNSNWEILTKNLVTLQRWDGVKDEKLPYFGVHWKVQFFGGCPGGWSGKTNIEGGLPKNGGLDSLHT